MKKDKLVSMVEFIGNHAGKYETMAEGGYAPQMAEKLDLYENYANFLETPLNLSMFVPCEFVGGEWVVLEEPKFSLTMHEGGYTNSGDLFEANLKYQKAKELVLFDGFDFSHNSVITLPNKVEFIDLTDEWKIEELTEFTPTLTQNGLKQAGL